MDDQITMARQIPSSGTSVMEFGVVLHSVRNGQELIVL